jgi:hypothetical protein
MLLQMLPSKDGNSVAPGWEILSECLAHVWLGSAMIAYLTGLNLKSTFLQEIPFGISGNQIEVKIARPCYG